MIDRKVARALLSLPESAQPEAVRLLDEHRDLMWAIARNGRDLLAHSALDAIERRLALFVKSQGSEVKKRQEERFGL
jgi:hypothetical protein